MMELIIMNILMCGQGIFMILMAIYLINYE